MKKEMLDSSIDKLEVLTKKLLSEQSYDGIGIEATDEGYYPGLQVAIAHKLAPLDMRLTIPRAEDSNSSYIKSAESSYKYVFRYCYLDLNFTIKTDNDKIAAQLFPFFDEHQRTQIMAMTLGSKSEK